MNKLTFTILLYSSFLFSQENEIAKCFSHPTFSISMVTNNYYGENYLSKGHKSNSIGFLFKHEFIHYKKFNLGLGFEKSTQKITNTSIGGNIDKTNTNSIIGFLSYKIPITNKLDISPEINYGGIELRQKYGSKLYGVQNGSRLGFGASTDYMIRKHLSLNLALGYNKYNLRTETSTEFLNYFNTSESITLSLGLKFDL